MNPDRPPTFAQAFRFWVKLGLISFGGPTGQIAIMHTELVEKKKWINESRFLHALNYCMLLPGPEATQLAIYTGWLLHGTWGGIIAGVFFVLPSVFILLALSWVYAAHGNLPWIAAIFFLGLKPAVMAIVAHAVLRIGKKALPNAVMYALAALAFVAIFFWHVPFPVIIAAAGLLGFLGGKFWPGKFQVIKGHTAAGGAEPAMTLHPHALVAPTWGRGLRVLTVCLVVWWTPVLLLGLWDGWQSTFVKESVFFSKAALVTFGGAYAVLPYVAQAAVVKYGWLQAGQMLDGLGLAETTPGPLIMVLQFVGFLGGWQNPGALAPWLAGTIGALITTWVTFVPCFLWIFLGAPYIERLRDQAKLNAALSAITAAVVGVVLNLAVWFGLHTLFPEAGGVNWFAVTVGVVTFLGMWRWKWGVVPVVLGSGALGLLYRLLAPAL